MDSPPSEFDFWRSAKELGAKATEYANKELEDAIDKFQDTAKLVEEFKFSIVDLTASAANFRFETQDTFLITGFNETEFMERLHLKIEPFFEDLKKEFQESLPDDETEGSKQRRVVVEKALDKLEGALVEVYRQYGVPDTDVRDKFARIRPHILHVVLVTGGSRHIICQLHP